MYTKIIDKLANYFSYAEYNLASCSLVSTDSLVKVLIGANVLIYHYALDAIPCVKLPTTSLHIFGESPIQAGGCNWTRRARCLHWLCQLFAYSYRTKWPLIHFGWRCEAEESKGCGGQTSQKCIQLTICRLRNGCKKFMRHPGRVQVAAAAAPAARQRRRRQAVLACRFGLLIKNLHPSGRQVAAGQVCANFSNCDVDKSQIVLCQSERERERESSHADSNQSRQEVMATTERERETEK